MADVLTELQPIFRNVLDSPELVITRASRSADIEGWDSLAHVNLVTAIEQTFSIRFSLKELQELESVGEIADLIQTKLKG